MQDRMKVVEQKFRTLARNRTVLPLTPSPGRGRATKVSLQELENRRVRQRVIREVANRVTLAVVKRVLAKSP